MNKDMVRVWTPEGASWELPPQCPLCPPERLPQADRLSFSPQAICWDCLSEIKALLTERRNMPR